MFLLGANICMELIAAPIEMVCWFERSDKPYPIRFNNGTVVKVDQIVHTEEEKLAGNWMLIFPYQSEVDGVLKVFELKYEFQTYKWMLWKM